jgi:hypothetical protein
MLLSEKYLILPFEKTIFNDERKQIYNTCSR